jgi:hypothetical protein
MAHIKYNDIKDINRSLQPNDLANLFNVYTLNKNGTNSYVYNINRTINMVGIENMSNTNYSLYKVQNGDTWPLISYKNYNTTRLWWLVCKVNQKFDPTDEPEVGSTVKIINTSIVEAIIKSIRRG